MDVYYALWPTRGPRSVVDRDGLFFVSEDALYRLQRALGQIVLVRVSLLAGVLYPYDLDAIVHAFAQLL